MEDFFVIESKFINYIKNDKTFLEREPLEIVTKKKQLVAFKHKGFWHCMDSKRDKEKLEEILKAVEEKNFNSRWHRFLRLSCKQKMRSKRLESHKHFSK